jgi:hypothetical protein
MPAHRRAVVGAGYVGRRPPVLASLGNHVTCVERRRCPGAAGSGCLASGSRRELRTFAHRLRRARPPAHSYGLIVSAFDPAVRRPPDDPDVRVRSAIVDACDGADAIAIATECPDFAELDLAALRRVTRGPFRWPCSDLAKQGACGRLPLSRPGWFRRLRCRTASPVQPESHRSSNLARAGDTARSV